MRPTLILALFLFFYLLPLQAKGLERVCIKKVCVECEIADTDALRAQGLMFRAHLAPYDGMLFIFPEAGQYAFWMKNMKLALDIIWIGADNKVVGIKENFPPCSGTCDGYEPGVKALYVLEVNAGFTQKHNIRVGDPVRIEHIYQHHKPINRSHSPGP